MGRKKVILTAITLLFISLLSKAQSETYSLKHFVPMDDSMKQMIAFYAADTILVISPDTYLLTNEDKKIIESFVFWKQPPIHVYKTASELFPEDSLYHRQYVGPLYMFQPDVLPNLPVNILPVGFSYCGHSFTDPRDALYYMHPSGKMIFTNNNSPQAGFPYVSYLAGGAYPFYVFNGNQIVFTGMYNDELQQLNDMDVLRDAYFCPAIHSRFFNLYFPCGMNLEQSKDLGNELDQFVLQICANLTVDPSLIKPVTSYFYKNRIDLQYFIAAPLWQTVYGKSFGDINHITGFDLQIFKHEAGHSVINATLGINPSPFFSEGLRQYTDYGFNSDAYLKDLRITRENIQLLTPELIFDNGEQFFRNMTHYNISGVFTGFLIHVFGPIEFKAAYSQNSFEELFFSKGYTLEKLIESFKKECLTQ